MLALLAGKIAGNTAVYPGMKVIVDILPSGGYASADFAEAGCHGAP